MCHSLIRLRINTKKNHFIEKKNICHVFVFTNCAMDNSFLLKALHFLCKHIFLILCWKEILPFSPSNIKYLLTRLCCFYIEKWKVFFFFFSNFKMLYRNNIELLIDSNFFLETCCIKSYTFVRSKLRAEFIAWTEMATVLFSVDIGGGIGNRR